MKSLVGISEKLELGLVEKDFEELLECHDEDISNDDLQQLEEQQRPEEEMEEEEAQPKKFDTKKLAESFLRPSHSEMKWIPMWSVAPVLQILCTVCLSVIVIFTMKRKGRQSNLR